MSLNARNYCLPPSPIFFFCLLFQLTRTSWLCERQILGIEPASSFKRFTLSLPSRLKTSLCLTVTGEVSTRRGPHKAYTSQLLQHLSHDTTSYSYTWGGYRTNVSLFTLIVSVCVDLTGSRHKNTIRQLQVLLNFSDEDLCFTLDCSPFFL